MSAAGKRWMELIGQLSCVVCERTGIVPQGRIHLHHVAEGSGLRSDFAIAPLCEEHHTGKSGLHGMGTKAFIRLYRPPGDTEYGLLVWTAEDLESYLWATDKRRDAA